MNSSVHIHNKKKDILILGKGQTQWLCDTTLTTEAQYSLNFSISNRKFCSSYIVIGTTVFYLLVLQKYIIQSKRFWNKKVSLVFRKISEDFWANNMKKRELNGCMYNVSVDYKTFDTSNTIDILEYLVKKHNLR